MRRALWLAVAVVLAVLTGCSSAPVHDTRVIHHAAVRHDPLQAGMAYGDTLPFLPGRQLSSALDDDSQIGGRLVRADLAWDDVEPTPGRYSWTGFDRVVAAARARHLHVLALLAYTPAFARPRGCDSDKCGPGSPAAFAAFAAAAVRRYARLGLHDWEIWNEPNSDGFWLPHPDPAAYARLVRLTAAAIRKVQPAATIILGSMAAGKLTGVGIPALQFLRQLCAAGVNKVVSAIGWHPYSYPLLPSSPNPHNPWNLISADSPSFESILARAGTPDLPVWITEYGAPTGGPGQPASSPKHARGVFPAYVTQAFQARLARVAVAVAEANPHVAAFLWFTDRDTPGPADQRINFFGLRQVDGQPKPALSALRQAISKLPR